MQWLQDSNQRNVENLNNVRYVVDISGNIQKLQLMNLKLKDKK